MLDFGLMIVQITDNPALYFNLYMVVSVIHIAFYLNEIAVY